MKNNRIKEFLEVLEETDGKVIIWAVYRYDIQQIEKTLGEKYGKESVATYYGDTKDNIRQSVVDRFMDPDDPLYAEGDEEDEWIVSNVDWLADLFAEQDIPIDEEHFRFFYQAVNAEDWRCGSCGGC